MPFGAYRLNGLARVLGSRTAKVITAHGNAEISTSQYKFGGSSAAFDGSGDYLSTNASADFNPGSGNWTWEFWAWTNTTAAGARIPVAGKIDYEPLPYMTAGTMRLYLSKTGTAWDLVNGVTMATMTANTWAHLAIVRNGTSIKTYKDGTQTSSTTVGASDVVWWSQNQLYIGDIDPSYSTAYWNGYIDEVRISDVARYTAAFTPSTSAFVNDANTVFLMHADGTNHSTAFVDDNS